MSVQRLIPERKLAEILGITPAGLAKLRREKRVRSDATRGIMRTNRIVELEEKPDDDSSEARNAVHFYTLSTIDNLLLAPGIAKNFTTPPPTAAELLAGSDKLLTIDEACKALGKPYKEVYYTLIQGGYLPVIYLFHSMPRIPASAAAAMHAELNNDAVIEKEVASLLLGIHENTVKIWARDPDHPLERVVVPGSPVLHVTRESLTHVIRGLLPDHVAVSDWWRYRIRHRDPLLTVAKLQRLCHARNGTLTPRLLKENIPFILTPGGQKRIPQWAVHHWIENATPLSPDELAKIFGTPLINEVKRPKLCNEHRGRALDTCPRRGCIERYIETHRTRTDISPEGWIASALEDDAPPTTVTDMLKEFPDLTPEDITNGLESGTIAGVRLPFSGEEFGEIALTVSSVLFLQRLALRRDRRAGGTTPYLRYDEFLK